MSSVQLSPLPHAKRSDVFTALYQLLLTTPPPVGEEWRETGQYLKQWDDVPAANQPALFLQRGSQLAEQRHAYGVTGWLWNAIVWIYFRTDGLKTETSYPDQLTDQFLDNIEQIMQTDPLAGPFTLGGLVQQCFIDGHCFTDPGLVDNQAVIVVPISILV